MEGAERKNEDSVYAAEYSQAWHRLLGGEPAGTHSDGESLAERERLLRDNK